MNERTNPFADLKIPQTFSTKPKASKPVEEQTIARIADDNNFTSREPPKTSKTAKRKPRIHRTGRNQQFTAKATAETIGKVYKLADERNVPLGELLKLAVDALEREDADKQSKPAPA
jgi:hypothetical protein